jgi:hypothetical protein
MVVDIAFKVASSMTGMADGEAAPTLDETAKSAPATATRAATENRTDRYAMLQHPF